MRRWTIMAAAAIAVPGGHAAGQWIAYKNFNSTTGLTLVGNAAPVAPDLRLTAAAEGQAAAVWLTQKARVDRGFYSRFTFRISDAGGVPDFFGGLGADGLAFVVQNDSGAALGAGGSGMCYEGIPNSIAVELDTWGHPFFGDPDGNHVSVQTMGTAPNTYTPAASIGLSGAIPELTSGIHEVVMSYDALNEELHVTIDGAGALSVPLNLSTLLSLDGGRRAWVGFTSSTGGAFENHDLTRWEYRATCYPDCNQDSLLTVADFGCFQTKFVTSDPYPDCNRDGQLTVADFGCFQTEFITGCQ